MYRALAESMTEVNLGNESVATEGGDYAKDVVERGVVKMKLIAGDIVVDAAPDWGGQIED